MTSDGLPIIDRVPGKEWLLVASGHIVLGLLLSPVTQAVVSLLDGRAPAAIASFRLKPIPSMAGERVGRGIPRVTDPVVIGRRAPWAWKVVRIVVDPHMFGDALTPGRTW